MSNYLKCAESGNLTLVVVPTVYSVYCILAPAVRVCNALGSENRLVRSWPACIDSLFLYRQSIVV